MGKCIAKVLRTTLLHMWVAVLELSGLVGRRRHPGKGQQLVWRFKPREVTDFGQAHGSHAATHTRDCCNGRMKFIYNRLKLFFNFSYLGIQFSENSDGMLQFEGLGRHFRANGVSGFIPNRHGIPFVAAI